MSVVDATAHAGVNRTTPYTWETADPDFARIWAAIRSYRLRQLTDIALDTALEGDTNMMRFLINRYDKSTRDQVRTIGEILITTQEKAHDTGHPLPFLTVDP